jgi:hypothetical protein
VPWFKEFIMLRFVSHIDIGSIKVLWVTYQIISSSSFNLDITVCVCIHVVMFCYVYKYNVLLYMYVDIIWSTKRTCP